MNLGGIVLTLKDILNRILKNHNITKGGLATILGVTPQFVSALFADSKKYKRKLNFEHVEILKEKLNLSQEEVYELKRNIGIPNDPDLNSWLDKLEDSAYKFELLSSNKGLEEIIDNVYKIKKSKTREVILEFILYQLAKEQEK